MVKAVIYARVATSDPVSDFGLATQLYHIRAFASQAGMEIIAEFTDIQSGTTLERDGLSQVRALLHTGAAQALIVTSLERLSRRPVHLLILRDELHNAGVDLYCALAADPAGPMEITDAIGRAAIEAAATQVMQERVRNAAKKRTTPHKTQEETHD